MNGGSENYCHEFRQSEPLSWDEQLTSYQVCKDVDVSSEAVHGQATAVVAS